MKKIIFVLLLVISIFIIGCAEEIEEKDDESTKEISIEGAKGETKPAVKTEIKVTQMGVEMIISPTKDHILNGVVSIKASKVPEGTETVAFVIQGQGIPDMGITGPNLGIDKDGSDGWATEFDTKAYDNGVYTLLAIAAKEGAGDGTPPLGGAQVKIYINNTKETLLTAPEIGFYKGVHLWEPQFNRERIKEAKELGANAVIITLFLDYKNGKPVLPDGWKPYLETSINEAYREGLAVSLLIELPSEYRKSFPYRPGSGIDLPDGYDISILIEDSKNVYKDIAIFAEENDVHSIIVPIELEEWIGRVFQDATEYWEKSSKLDQEVLQEIKKYYKGEIIGDVLGGAWGFGVCCYTNIPMGSINLKGYDSLWITLRSDPYSGQDPSTMTTEELDVAYTAFIEEVSKVIEFTRNEICTRNNIKKIYFEIGGYPATSYRVKLYDEIFNKTNSKVDGYSISYLLKGDLWKDPESFDVAKIWFKKR